MKTHWILRASWILLVLTSLVGCGSLAVLAPLDTGSSLSTQAPTASPAIVDEPARPQVQLPSGNVSTDSIKLAEQDLVQRLGVSLVGITVTAVIGQEFSTTAFYCRATKDRIARDDSPSAMSGFSILLSVSGQLYEYHASGQTVIFCRPLP